MATKPIYTAGDYRPKTTAGAQTKARLDMSDYRPGFSFSVHGARTGHAKAKKAGMAKHLRYSRRLAPGASRDAWGRKGMA